MRSLVASLALSTVMVAAANAQTKATAGNLITINGVVKTTDGQPLRAAEVIAGEIRAITSDSGAFVLRNVPGGSVFLVVRRIGYVPGTLSFDTEPALREVSVEARLVPSAVTLGTVVVEGKSMDRQLWQGGYYKRQLLGEGVFFDPERLKKTAADLSTLMQEVPNVFLSRGRGGERIPVAKVGAGRTVFCPLNVFLDGSFLPWAAEVGIDNVIAQQDVKAIEVYPRRMPLSLAGAPAARTGPSGIVVNGYETGGANVECGAILLWSKSIAEARADAKSRD